MAFGIYKADNGNITGFSAPVQPDKGFSRSTTPRVIQATFGDGYEQRARVGINSLVTTYSVTFSNRIGSNSKDLLL